MRHLRLFWSLYLSNIGIILAGLAFFSWYLAGSIWNFHLSQVDSQLTAQARLISESLAPLLSGRQEELLESRCVAFSKASGSRITIILTGGRVLCDSEEDPQSMDNHSDRPEIIAALLGGRGASTRFSNTLKQEMRYIALPMNTGGAPAGVVRVSLPVRSLNEVLQTEYANIFITGLFTALAIAVLSAVVSSYVTHPLKRIRKGAELIAGGNLDVRLPLAGTAEMSGLAQTLNRMTEDLRIKLQTIRDQQVQLDAVFTSMKEGVVAVDEGNLIFTLNPAAAEMLNITAGSALGRSLLEVVRNTQLHDFLASLLDGQGRTREDFSLSREEGVRHIQVYGTAIKGQDGGNIGALIVMNDITHLKRLENIRKDFVANVSHELKTPITSIKGAVETLQEGAVRDPAASARFLDMISKNSTRLSRIIEDLLSLSRIEQDTEKRSIILEQYPLAGIIHEAVQLTEPRAAAKGITLHHDIPSSHFIRVNPPLLEEAVSNLLDNAVKYSSEGGHIYISAVFLERECLIHVKDEGIGISGEHLPRLFERFYRVDKSRSRKQGGTGLGLAIVKHIMQTHGGSVSVKSEPGEGSEFTLHIPV